MMPPPPPALDGGRTGPSDRNLASIDQYISGRASAFGLAGSRGKLAALALGKWIRLGEEVPALAPELCSIGAAWAPQSPFSDQLSWNPIIVFSGGCGARARPAEAAAAANFLERRRPSRKTRKLWLASARGQAS